MKLVGGSELVRKGQDRFEAIPLHSAKDDGLTLDESKHRRFLVLDEQDCWLRPDLVPKLVKIVHDAGKALGFQVLMISHHDISAFEQYADKIYEVVPVVDGTVEMREMTESPIEEDHEL